MTILLTNADQLFNYGDNFNLKKSRYGSCLMAYLPVAPIRAGLSLYLHCSEDFFPSEQIESHLPEKGIYAILNEPGKVGAKSIIVQVA